MITPEPSTMWETILTGAASLIAAMSAIIFYSFRAKILKNEERISVLEKEVLVDTTEGAIYQEQSAKDHAALDKLLTKIFEELKEVRKEIKEKL